MSSEGAFNRVIEVDKSGFEPPRTVIGLTQLISGLDVARDGTIYLDQYSYQIDIVRVSTSPFAVEKTGRFPLVTVTYPAAVYLPDGRIVLFLPSDRSMRLMLVDRSGGFVPVAGESELTRYPMTTAGPGRIACMIGPDSSAEIALVNVETRRVAQRIPFHKGNVESPASAPDGRTLFATADDVVWKVPLSGAEPEKLRAGRYVVIDTETENLLVQAVEADRVRLFRVPLKGGRSARSPWKDPNA